LILDGSRTTRTSGIVMYSAHDPQGRCHCASYIHTRSPIRTERTSVPTASTTPAPSWCGMMRAYDIARVAPPLRLFVSDGLTADACTRTRTSSVFGVGASTEAT